MEEKRIKLVEVLFLDGGEPFNLAEWEMNGKPYMWFIAEETEEYILHRLECAGRTETVFEPSSFDLIHSATRGVPREINNLCDLCLLIGSGEEADRIGVSLVDRALEEQAGGKVFGEGDR